MKRTLDGDSQAESRSRGFENGKRPRNDSYRPSRAAMSQRQSDNPNPHRDSAPVNRRPGKKNGAKYKEGTHLSNKIHSLRRLLDKATDMPADVRQEKERELAGYIHDQARKKERADLNDLVSRYHFVRFLERKKAEKRLKKAKTAPHLPSTSTESNTPPRSSVPQLRDRQDVEMSEDSEEEGGVELPQSQPAAETTTSSDRDKSLTQSEYEQQLHEAEVDLNYTLFAPLNEKYISLFTLANDNPSKPEPEGMLRSRNGEKPPRWYDIEAAMAAGTLEALRDGKGANETSTAAADHSLTLRASTAEKGSFKDKGIGEKEKMARAQPVVAAENDQSDGGFFER